MKKIIIAAILATSIASSVFAQGTLNYGSFIPTFIGASTNATQYSPLMGGGAANGTAGLTATAANGFYYELLWTASGASAPTSLAGLASWTDSSYYALNSSASAGKLTLGNGNNGVAVAGMALGTPESIMLVGWSANLGTTWSSALATLNSPIALAGVVGNAFLGLSSVGTVTPTTTTAPGATIFGASPLINSPNTQLYLVPTAPVPEPGTMALAALGGASLLMFRRRK